MYACFDAGVAEVTDALCNQIRDCAYNSRERAEFVINTTEEFVSR